MDLVSIIELIFYVAILLLLMYLISFFVRFILKKIGVKMEHEPNFFDLIIGPFDSDSTFWSDTFKNVKNPVVRKMFNLFLSILINLIFIVLILLVIFVIIYFVAKHQ